MISLQKTDSSEVRPFSFLLALLVWAMLPTALAQFTPTTTSSNREIREKPDSIPPGLEIPKNLRGFDALSPSVINGAAVLTNRLECLSCHSLDPADDNGFPNLASIGTRLSRDEIVTAIVDPSRDLAAGHKSITLELADGRVVGGIQQDEKSTSETLAITTQTSDLVLVPRAEIVAIQTSQSEMPVGQVNHLSAQEFADLIAFLFQLRDGHRLPSP